MPQYSRLWNEEFQKNTAFIDRLSLTTALEIGCYEGLTSNYIVDQLLAPTGVLTCVDPLEDNYQLDNEPDMFKGQFERFTENIEKNKNNIWHIRKKSEDVLHVLRDGGYQFIYVDGHHRYNNVYYDFTEAFRLCAVSGYILCDDYLWNSATFEVKHAIDRVLEENPNHRLLLKLNQVLIQKLPEGSPTENGQSDYQRRSIEKLFNSETIYAAYCNLDERKDRNEKMIAELKRVDWEIPIVRQKSFQWEELYNTFTDEEKERVQVMIKRKTPGAIGCWFSQMEVMKEALRQGKHAIVLEDDLVFCNDFPARTKIIFEFLNQRDWDIMWFGGTYHLEPTWHKSIEGVHTHEHLKGICHCTLNRDWEETNDLSIRKTFGAFSTHAYMVNKNRIEHILMLLERDMKISMGIDFCLILEQPNLNCYAFNPGCIKQYDNQSNIGDGISRFSGFRNLGKHWFSKSMHEYIPD